ncbi:MAG: cysteine hydrolase [Candidatus Obscuribacterales bacterium]|jgi:nicotinamidase-related amidase|nr:cysteine hydrolase [Candidatus Obscuribacterales bacterium]
MSENLSSKNDKSETALILIDVINDLDFEGNEELVKKVPTLTESLARLKAAAKAIHLPVIYVNDNFHKWRSDFEETLKHCLNNSVPGRMMAEKLSPDSDDYFVLKPMHSGFYCTPLEILLSELGVKTLILAGVAGNICVLFTANDAYMRGYKLIVPRECVESNTQEDNEFAFDQMEKLHSAKVIQLDDLIASFKTAA